MSLLASGAREQSGPESVRFLAQTPYCPEARSKSIPGDSSPTLINWIAVVVRHRVQPVVASLNSLIRQLLRWVFPLSTGAHHGVSVADPSAQTVVRPCQVGCPARLCLLCGGRCRSLGEPESERATCEEVRLGFASGERWGEVAGRARSDGGPRRCSDSWRRRSQTPANHRVLDAFRLRGWLPG